MLTSMGISLPIIWTPWGGDPSGSLILNPYWKHHFSLTRNKDDLTWMKKDLVEFKTCVYKCTPLQTEDHAWKKLVSESSRCSHPQTYGCLLAACPVAMCQRWSRKEWAILLPENLRNSPTYSHPQLVLSWQSQQSHSPSPRHFQWNDFYSSCFLPLTYSYMSH